MRRRILIVLGSLFLASAGISPAVTGYASAAAIPPTAQQISAFQTAGTVMPQNEPGYAEGSTAGWFAGNRDGTNDAFAHCRHMSVGAHPLFWKLFAERFRSDYARGLFDGYLNGYREGFRQTQRDTECGGHSHFPGGPPRG